MASLSALMAFSIAAQDFDEWDDDPFEPRKINWNYTPVPYAKGDKTFNMSIGIIIPALFTGEGMDGPHNLRIGGTGSFAYNYYLNPYFFVGGELSGMFSPTVGGNMLYAVPFGARIGYHLVFGRFEFPITLLAGGAPQLYLGWSYFGPIIKPGVSGFFRFSNDWSFGVNGQWWMLPQWPKKDADGRSRNVLGNFVEVTLSARYHF